MPTKKPIPIAPADIDESKYLTVTAVSKLMGRTSRAIRIQIEKRQIPGVILREGDAFKPYYLIPRSSLRFVCAKKAGRPKKHPVLPPRNAPIDVIYRDEEGKIIAPPGSTDPEFGD